MKAKGPTKGTLDPSNANKPKAEPRLRFNFRFQRWVDVLEWFAQQADLSLVLDAPPPGTFNYSDTKQYTPTEAIDLLNGVLMTKGYALIRRDRMLVVIHLAGGIPEGLIPRVSLAELDKRGRFELVSVLFPLGRRNVQEVHTEITQLLSPHGKAVPLPKTNQLLVTDTAGIMKALGQMIEAIPEPRRRRRPNRPKRRRRTRNWSSTRSPRPTRPSPWKCSRPCSATRSSSWIRRSSRSTPMRSPRNTP